MDSFSVVSIFYECNDNDNKDNNWIVWSLNSSS